MRSSASFIEKLRVAVQISISSGPALTGGMAVLPVSEHHVGPETLLDRLNASQRMFPLEGSAEGGVVLINPLDVEVVRPAEGTPPILICTASYGTTREERVRVRMMSGVEIEGVVRFELPEGLNRVSDYMNCLEDFFALDAHDGVCLVNKRLMSTIRLFHGSPKPAPPAPPQLRRIEGGAAS